MDDLRTDFEEEEGDTLAMSKLLILFPKKVRLFVLTGPVSMIAIKGFSA